MGSTTSVVSQSSSFPMPVPRQDTSHALPHSMHDALHGNGPVGPVGATLAVHHIRRPQRPICAQLGSAPIDECPIPKDDLILIPWRHPCICMIRLAQTFSVVRLYDWP